MTDLPAQATPDDAARLPEGDEIFLDHVGHFVRDGGAASRALARCGFAPTPISIQVSPDAAGGAQPTGTGNVTAMLDRGYLEILFKTSDTPLSRELEAALNRHAGLHLAAFAVADAEKAQRRLAADGFAVRDLVHMQRQVETVSGAATAAFTIARVEPEAMSEGRIQLLTHHTEQAVWQERWLKHPNSAIGLIDVVIAVADVEEAAARFVRFTGRKATRTSGGALIRLDRGGVYLVTHDRVTERLPEVAITSLPFMAGYALCVQSLDAAEAAVDRANLEWRAIDDGIVAAFPSELGEGAWFFVERVSALPWRRREAIPRRRFRVRPGPLL
ncbi:MAG: VOC family protein [Xanthobacteraceae bacterium]